MPNELRLILLIGSVLYLFVIFFLLKKGKLNVQYSIIWLGLAFAFILFSSVPQVIYILRDIFSIEVPVNLVFTMLFGFIILLLLSLSIIVTGFANKIKRLTQTQALLEKRVRELEQQVDANTADTSQPKQ